MIPKVTGTALQAQATNLYQKAIADYGISTLFMVVTFVCLFTPSLMFFKQLAANTLYIMLGLLITGFLFFIFKCERLMVVSLFCCAVLCLHLKESSNKQMRLAAVTESPSLKISHINLGNAENDYDSVINYLLKLDADFVSFQELTPDWNKKLKERLAKRFGYINTMTRLDQYGMGFFSKYPFVSMDTLYYKDVPNLATSILMEDNHLCQIVSCQVIPPVNQGAFVQIGKHFDYVADYLDNLEGCKIVLGDLNLPPWASEVQKFRAISNLEDSRRDINPRNLDGSVSLPRIPVEHIFYCDKFECTSFSELGNAFVGRVGITGTYQIEEGQAQVVQ